MSKYKILIIGYSSFFRRRVLNSLKKMSNIEIYICSKSHKIDKNKRIFFNNYEYAIKNYKFDFVYISLVNSFHYKYAKLSLENKLNTIVDKPITTNYLKTLELIKIANKNKILLAEFIVFNHHRIFKKVLEIFNGVKNIEFIYSKFNAPFAESCKKLLKIKKGINQDMGPYAAAIDRIFFFKKKKKILLNKSFKNKLVTNFNINILSNKLSYYGEFSISKKYRSSIVFVSKNRTVEIPFQAFALSSLKQIKINVYKNNKFSQYSLKDDYILLFLINFYLLFF